MGKRLFVGNLSYETTEDSLRTAFEEAGLKVADCHIVRDRETGLSRGFGFVETATQEEAGQAVETMDNASVDGRGIRVNEARDRERGPGGPGGGGGGPPRGPRPGGFDRGPRPGGPPGGGFDRGPRPGGYGGPPGGGDFRGPPRGGGGMDGPPPEDGAPVRRPRKKPTPGGPAPWERKPKRSIRPGPDEAEERGGGGSGRRWEDEAWDDD